MKDDIVSTIRAIIFSLSVLGFGLLLLWFVRFVIGVEEEATYIALLVLPALFFLIATGRLSGFSMGNLSVDFFEREVAKLESTITTVGQFEQTRVEFLGKLDQIMSKDIQPACVAYADIDGLRGLTRTLYERERRETEDPSSRRSEREIRASLIHRLALAFTDAFYDANVGNKHELFKLNEPDVIMVARQTDTDAALAISRQATQSFSARFLTEFPQLEQPSVTVSIILVDPNTFSSAIAADRDALEKLARAKEISGMKGRVSFALVGP